MKKLKTNKGITLIALIITIIVLLILAVVAINSITESKIIEHANTAATEYNNKKKLEEEELQNYINFIEEHSPTGGAGSSTGITWTKTSSGDLAVGSTVKASNNEEFYVIGFTTDNKAKLLAAKNVNTSTNKQDDNANTVRFDDDSSTYEGSEIEGLVNAYAETLGATGRLMTLEEVKALGGDDQNQRTSDCPDFVNSSNYWLGYARDTNYVWNVYGDFGYLGRYKFYNDVNFGLRPVIEISEPSIS